MSNLNINLTNIPAPRVEFIDPRTGLMSREWYRFFLNLFNLTGQGQNTTSLTDLQVGPPAPTQEDITDLIIQIDSARTQPTQESALEQIAELQKSVEGLATQTRAELGTMSELQQANVPWVTFDTTAEHVPADVGTIAWDGGTTLGIQMTANVLQQVGEAQYYYIKADSAITKGQLIMFTGAVGASGVIRGAPATGLTDGQYLMGIAAENIANNGFGLVASFGHVRGWNTTGAPVGETWADGDILYYNPSVAGGLTKTQPIAPNVKATIAVVVNAAPAGSGDVFVRVSTGSVLGGTDSNVQFGTLANNNIIQYDSALGYWKNVALSAAGVVTSVTGTSPVVSSGGSTPAISLASGYGDTQNPYAAKTANYVLAGPTTGAATAPTFRALVATDIPALSYISSIGVTAPITSTGGLTPTIGITQAGTASNGYLSSTDWNTFNNKQPAGAYVTSVSGTATRITSTGGTTPVIDLASGVATAGTTGSSTLIPVVTIDTYGRVTSITTAANPQGTVTSVATGTGLTGGTITSSGTISFAVAAVGTWAATPSSANLAAAMTDETGSGSLVFATQPSFASTIGVGGATASASGAGITFPATVNLSTNANTLDDYEEGSFTPVLTTSGTAPTLTYSEQSGRYVKIGMFVLVVVQIRVDITNVGTGYPRVTGFPFAAESGFVSGISVGIQNAFGTYPATYVPNAYLVGTAAYFETAALKITSGGYVTFSAVFRTTS